MIYPLKTEKTHYNYVFCPGAGTRRCGRRNLRARDPGNRRLDIVYFNFKTEAESAAADSNKGPAGDQARQRIY